MESADPLGRPDDCACAWISGYGVDDDRPTEWVSRILILEEGCPEHGEQTS